MNSAPYCYFSVADGDWADMLAVAVRSARAVGVDADFHLWTDRAIEGATVHSLRPFDKSHYLFKLDFLREAARCLPYQYFVWIDADTVFVRDPGNPLEWLAGSPIHVTLESDACASDNIRPDWWGCPLLMFTWLMQMLGVRGRSIYNVNAGFWIVHRDAVETVCRLAGQFWEFGKAHGYVFTEEAPLAYAMQMLCADVAPHTLRATSSFWASDWRGEFGDRLPDGRPWLFEDYFNGRTTLVDPAIVHAMRSKPVMIDAGQRAGRATTLPAAQIARNAGVRAR